ncbi:MAG: DUF971 domain-containing protein [Phycisphaerae bacterium]|nr:DUF971 domain-containing protein [Phycisphaerae bacterium]
MAGDETKSSSDSPRGEGRGPHDASVSPADLKLRLREQELLVQWKDGTTSRFDLAVLRKNCPCATCRTEREQRDDNPLKVLRSDPTDVRVVNAKLVGQYAIQFEWSDGHDTGIFDFRYLRSLE